jgi:FtsH-binding integral membrane protein
MVAFYLWPTLAIALIAASRSWPRLVATAAVTTTLTFVSQASWRGPWLWWGLMVAGLGLTLFFARVRPDGPACARARDGE